MWPWLLVQLASGPAPVFHTAVADVVVQVRPDDVVIQVRPDDRDVVIP